MTVSEEEKEGEVIKGKQITNKMPFVPVYHDLLDSEKLSGEEQIIYIQLSRYLNKQEDCSWPSISRLCAKLDWGKDKVQKYINQLIQKGFVRKQNNIHKTKQNNKYYLIDIKIATGKQEYHPYNEEEEVNPKLYIFHSGRESERKIYCYSEKVKFHLEWLIENYIPQIEESLVRRDDIDPGTSTDSIVLLLLDAATKQTIPVNKTKISSDTFFEGISQTPFQSFKVTLNKVREKIANGEVQNTPAYVFSSLFNSRLEVV